MPIVVYAPGNDRWGKPHMLLEQMNVLQVAPTLSELLGISMPPAATLQPLP